MQKMNTIEAMRTRHSVRTFSSTPLSNEMLESLLSEEDYIDSPFGGNVEIRLRRFDSAADYRPSTYGMIRGASDYFLIAHDGSRESQLKAGFLFEQVVIRAWQAGLGTCWIAATFRNTAFDEGQTWADGMQLRLVSPIGIAAARPSMIEKISRFTVKANRRKPFDQLFYSNNFDTPLSDTTGFYEPLAMMRLAPSSTNSQPWRAVVVGAEVHFYYIDKSKCALTDMGIGLCHFMLAERTLHGRCGLLKPSSTAPAPPPSLCYLTSYRRP